MAFFNLISYQVKRAAPRRGGGGRHHHRKSLHGRGRGRQKKAKEHHPKGGGREAAPPKREKVERSTTQKNAEKQRHSKGEEKRHHPTARAEAAPTPWKDGRNNHQIDYLILIHLKLKKEEGSTTPNEAAEKAAQPTTTRTSITHSKQEGMGDLHLTFCVYIYSYIYK